MRTGTPLCVRWLRRCLLLLVIMQMHLVPIISAFFTPHRYGKTNQQSNNQKHAPFTSRLGIGVELTSANDNANDKSANDKSANDNVSAVDDNGDIYHIHSGNVTVLDQNEHYLVVSKPPAVVCHHSQETGSRSNKEVPMLQRVREATGKRVNLVHRLDRGCSGCLLMTYSHNADRSSNSSTCNSSDNGDDDEDNATGSLIQSMASGATNKTYVALVRGEGVLRGRDFKQEGWFRVDRPIENRKGISKNATTWFRFVAGQHNANGTLDRPRASLVLARPETGRWHQIRKHLSGLSHPILGDSTHGISKENRLWKKRGLLPERTCLHLAKLELEPTHVSPDGIVVTCPLAPDMLRMLQDHLPDVLQQALPILQEEGIDLNPGGEFLSLPYQMKVYQ
jgi:tRNA pseudouridine65 synthase